MNNEEHDSSELRDPSDDFELYCDTTGDNEYLEIECIPKAVSARMKKKYGNCDLGSMLLVKDKYVLDYLEKNYNIPSNKTIILNLIRRGKECDKKNELRSVIGMNMLCGLLQYLDVEYIYLVALNKKLVELYSKYGFTLINEESKEMLGKVSNIYENCEKKMKVRKI